MFLIRLRCNSVALCESFADQCHLAEELSASDSVHEGRPQGHKSFSVVLELLWLPQGCATRRWPRDRAAKRVCTHGAMSRATPAKLATILAATLGKLRVLFKWSAGQGVSEVTDRISAVTLQSAGSVDLQRAQAVSGFCSHVDSIQKPSGVFNMRLSGFKAPGALLSPAYVRTYRGTRSASEHAAACLATSACVANAAADQTAVLLPGQARAATVHRWHSPAAQLTRRVSVSGANHRSTAYTSYSCSRIAPVAAQSAAPLPISFAPPAADSRVGTM